MAWLSQIDPDSMKGLEIGALDKPHFDRTRTPVRYVDHATTAELREKYVDDDVMKDRLDLIVDVDFVWGATSRSSRSSATTRPTTSCSRRTSSSTCRTSSAG